jgi:Bacterial Ig-like domain (group 3)
MKKTFVILIIFSFALLPLLTVQALAATRDYGTITLQNWGTRGFDEVWDLTEGDLTLSYELDMSNITTAGWAVVEVGLREVGAPNLDPNNQGGWLQSNYVYGTSNPGNLNDNDNHFLSKHGWLEQKYDAVKDGTGNISLITPYWSGDNHGFWFDRDGVNTYQASLWDMSSGGVYNTAGVYDIVVTYKALDETTGVMFATINGVQQGLYVGGWKNAPPELYPAGRTFVGNMKKMQVFAGRGGGGGDVTISGIQVDGPLVPVTPTIEWNPVDIVYGTPLGGEQLNATARVDGIEVPGTFEYTPGAGTILSAGDVQTLHVHFTPTDQESYTGAEKDVTIDVKKADTALSLTSCPNPACLFLAFFGQKITFTATVTAVAPGGGTPDGTVTFYKGTRVLGTGTLDSTGKATCRVSALCLCFGKISVTAVYSGGSNHNPCTSPTMIQWVL